MRLEDDGDIIKATGYVAIYAAYLEESIDECVEFLIYLNGFSIKDASKIRKEQTKCKLDFIEEQVLLLDYDSFEVTNYVKNLTQIYELLIERNNVIHCRIYALPVVGDTQISSKNNTKKAIDSKYLYSLAGELFNSRDYFKNLTFFIKRAKKLSM
jgi:hypothetical protein